MEDLIITPMIRSTAEKIASWRYDGAYAFYDHSEEGIDDFMDGTHFACESSQLGKRDNLVGYFCYGDDARIPTLEENVYDKNYLDIGLGLRPDLCGNGLGLLFVQKGLTYARIKFGAEKFRLSVAVFNERAIKVYERAGFNIDQTVTNAYFKNKFYIMKLEGK